MTGAVAHGFFAPVRWLLNAWPSEWNVQQEMQRSASLTFECQSDRILVRPVRRRHQGSRGAWAIARALRHLEPTSSPRPYTEGERTRFRRLTGHAMVGDGHPIYKLPVEYGRSSRWYDEQLWEAVAEKVSALTAPISLAEFQAIEITSYVESRPLGFDSFDYYKSYR
ncbi:MAG TPA: hypothetical protein VI168_16220 [Croceibacterium sp.]